MKAKNPETPEPSDYDVSLFELQARFARVMGNPARLQILHCLVTTQGSELATSELIDATGLSKSALSQHLEKMSAVGLVLTRREGRYLRVRLAAPEIGQACELIRVALSKFVNQRHYAIHQLEDRS